MICTVVFDSTDNIPLNADWFAAIKRLLSQFLNSLLLNWDTD